MKRWIRNTGTALFLLAVTAAPVWAADAPTAQPILIMAPVAAGTELKANLPLPAAVTVNGKPVTFDQGPVVVDGHLMLPLRAIIEGAGGKVTWDGATQTVMVRLGDRTAYVVIGNADAEMNQDNVRYIQRNMLHMAKAPVLTGGRTLVSADSLTTLFNFMQEAGDSGTLRLVVTPGPSLPEEVKP